MTQQSYCEERYRAVTKDHCLPPGCQSLTEFKLGELHLELGRFFTASANIQPKQVYCRAAFLGETTFSFLKPANSARDHPVALTFKIYSSLWHFHKYLQDCGSLEIQFIEANQHIGSVTIDLGSSLDKELLEGCQPLRQIDREFQVRAGKKLLGTVLVNLFTKFDHQLARQIKQIIPDVVKQRKNAWARSIRPLTNQRSLSRDTINSPVPAPTQQPVQQPSKPRSVSPIIVSAPDLPADPVKAYNPNLYLQQAEEQSSKQNSQPWANNHVVSVSTERVQAKSSSSTAQLQFYRRKQLNSAQIVQPVPEWLRFRSKMVLKVVDFISFHGKLSQMIGDGQLYFSVEVPCLKWKADLAGCTLKGDFLKLNHQATFPIEDQSAFATSCRTQDILLKIRTKGSDLEVGRAVFPFQRVWAARGEGEYSVDFINKVPLERLLLKGNSRNSASSTPPATLNSFRQTQLGKFRIATSFQWPDEIALDGSKRIAMYSKCKLFQMSLELMELRGVRKGWYHCRYKQYGSSQTLRTKEVSSESLNLRHKSVLPVPPQLLLRMETLPFIIEVWRRDEGEQLEGLAKVSLSRVPLCLLSKEKLINESAPALLDQYPLIIANHPVPIKSIAQQPRGQLYVALAFGTTPQIQRLMQQDMQDKQPQAKVPAPASAPKPLIPQSVLARPDVKLMSLASQQVKSTSSVMTQVDPVKKDSDYYGTKPLLCASSLRESAKKIIEEMATPQNSFLQVQVECSQSRLSEKTRRGWHQASEDQEEKAMPEPRAIEQHGEVKLSQTAIYLQSLTKTIQRVSEACPKLRQSITPKLKEHLQFGFVDTKRLAALLAEEGLDRSTVDQVLDIVDCRRQGLSFISTLWDYVKSCQTYGSVVKTVVDSNALATRLLAYFRARIREQIKDILVREKDGRVSRRAVSQQLLEGGVLITDEQLQLVFSQLGKGQSVGVLQLQRWAREGKQQRTIPEPSSGGCDQVLLLTQLINISKR